MFQTYNPAKNKILQIMDEEGKIVNPKFMPKISDKKVVEAYKLMLYARTVDLLMMSYQRQGRMYTFPPNVGQEGAAVGTGFVMRDIDWLIPAYRELGAYFHKGASAKDTYLYWGGHEDGSRLSGAKNMFPMSVPIGTQTLHATGIAYALKYKKQKGVVFTYIGDGGTSEGDFHEALNFAGVWKVPVVFVCQNNQYAISMPREEQTAAKNIAIKSIGYGIKGIMVDGNDFFACYAAAKASSEYAQAGNGPVLLEAITYRIGAHTTADDPTRYRTKEEEKQWEKKDPLARFKKYLLSKKIFKEEEEKKLVEEYKERATKEFLEFENYPAYELDDVFDHLYHTMPDDLKKQKEEYKQYLAWKEARS